MKRMLKNQKGQALVTTMMVLLVLSVSGSAVLGTVNSNHKMTMNEMNFQSAYYIAEAGLRYETQLFKQQVVTKYEESDNVYDFYNAVDSFVFLNYTTPKVLNSFEKINGIQPKAEIKIKRISPVGTIPYTYLISSKGVIGEEIRTVSNELKIQWVAKESFDFQTDMAVFSVEPIDLLNGNVNGPIGTSAEGSDAIDVSGNPNIDDVYLLEGSDINAPDWWKNNWTNGGNTQHTLPGPRTFDLPEFPDFPVYEKLGDIEIEKNGNKHKVIKNGSIDVTSYIAHEYTLQLDQNAYIPEININSNRIININLGDEDRSIVVNKINLDSGHINLIGEGKLTIYLKDKINLTGGSKINSPINEWNEEQVKNAVEKLMVYFKGTGANKKIHLTGSQKIYGSLYAQDSEISINNGSGFQGHIITGGPNVLIDGGTSVITSLLYAPNAFVEVKAGANIKGPIIAKKFTLDGGATITYSPTDDEIEIPIDGSDSTPGVDDIIPIQTAIREQ